MSTPNSIFISRLRGLPVLDSAGDQIGRVRDVVVQQSFAVGQPPRVKGMVVEIFGRQRVFVPLVRVHSIDAQQMIIAGIVDTRRFNRRVHETLVIDDLFDRNVTLSDGTKASIYDISMARTRTGDGTLVEVAVQEPSRRPFRKGAVRILPWGDVNPISVAAGPQSTVQLLAQMEDMNAADVARELHDLTPARRAEVAGQLEDEVLADALGELPEDEQVSLIQQLDPDRAADILEEMDPDDAADLIADLEPHQAEELLQLMEPEDAQDVRSLMAYEETTAGGMMTPEPVILPPDATVADGLAHVRNADLTPAMASTVFVTRSPQDCPTGRFLGGVHFQRLLRHPPSTLISELLDDSLEPIPPDASIAAVSRYFATYNLVVAPVVDAENRLVGAVSVDDVLDHMLPDDWRGVQMDNLSEDFHA